MKDIKDYLNEAVSKPDGKKLRGEIDKFLGKEWDESFKNDKASDNGYLLWHNEKYEKGDKNKENDIKKEFKKVESIAKKYKVNAELFFNVGQATISVNFPK